jgi:hypothetical protein
MIIMQELGKGESKDGYNPNIVKGRKGKCRINSGRSGKKDWKVAKYNNIVGEWHDCTG